MHQTPTTTEKPQRVRVAADKVHEPDTFDLQRVVPPSKRSTKHVLSPSAIAWLADRDERAQRREQERRTQLEERDQQAIMRNGH